LPFEESMKLLTTRLGPERTAKCGPGLATIVRLCGGLPLALCAAAERMLGDDQLAAQQLAAQLAEPRVALNAVSCGDFDLRARLDGSYGQLSSRDMSVFCLMSLLRSQEFNSSRAAGVLGWDADEAEQSLSRLAQQGLLDRTRRVSAAEGCYRYHGLIRRYAQERLEEILDDDSSRALAGRRQERHQLAVRLLAHNLPGP
jgi:predicted transcriptional regulator